MPTPVISVAQMREWEKASWAAGKTEKEVIRRVGHLVAERAHQMLRRNDSVVALYGRGNNGEDVLQSCRLFVDHEVHRVEAIHPDQALKEFQSVLALKPALILDGIFGIGLNRPLDEGYCRLVEAVNASGVPVLSVDVPSGMDADTGGVGTSAIRAAVTLTLGAPKRGLLKADAWRYVGRLEVAPQIGLVDCAQESELWWVNRSDFEWFPPMRNVMGHKGSYGHLAVVGGSVGYHGAAVLAARGAQRAQPGLITIYTMPEVYGAVAAQTQSVMVRNLEGEGVGGGAMELPERVSAVVVGPGLAGRGVTESVKREVVRWWRELEVPMLVDATALDWLEPGVGVGGEGKVRVITPHPGEAARMLGRSVAEVQGDREGALRKLSGKFGNCWVVLKGNQTLVGRAEGSLRVNSSGNPYLAQGGAGDVLAGWLGGWLAQGELGGEIGKLLAYGVWKHGEVADGMQAASVGAWTIEEMVTLGRWGGQPTGHPMTRLE